MDAIKDPDSSRNQVLIQMVNQYRGMLLRMCYVYRYFCVLQWQSTVITPAIYDEAYPAGAYWLHRISGSGSLSARIRRSGGKHLRTLLDTDTLIQMVTSDWIPGRGGALSLFLYYRYRTHHNTENRVTFVRSAICTPKASTPPFAGSSNRGA